MPRLSEKDMRDVLSITRTALECEKTDELRTVSLRLLQSVFNSGPCSFLQAQPFDAANNIDFRGGSFLDCVTDYLEQYSDYYYQFDPFWKVLPLCPTVTLLDEVLSSDDREGNKFYNDYLRPQSGEHVMHICLKSGKRLLGTICLSRAWERGNYTPEEKLKAEMIAPFISEILHKTNLLETNTEQVAIYEIVVDAKAHDAIIILDDTLRPLYMDTSARRILCDRFNISDPQIGVGDSVPDPIRRFCEKKRKTVKPKAGADAELACINRIAVDGQSYPVLFQILPDTEYAPSILVSLDPDQPKRSLDEHLQSFGLTKRAMEVTKLLFEGHKITEISDKLFISKHTVHNHIQNIYRSFNVNSRVELTHRLMELNIN